ncbi:MULTISPECIES: hypothetical protein [Rossellomorea]|uniref:Uncharacterized protein n=1 Tax=Rossellomorea vietnamensis TaxID=218284 RepID=A0A6I6UFE8_9BACI|nr:MULTISPECIES: hypothetical protein [Rossellomorea]QHE61595.1 hypothetical protein FHE72_11645 [Rossellomorea vietnamensis]WGG48107.1 hypothetical protein P8596_12155 [Rossellomorea sp. DA94]
MMIMVLAVFLLIFSFDFTKFRKQNQTMIEQNERIISLLEDIKKENT